MTSQQRAAWKRDGFFIVPGFESPAQCKAMHARAVELAREAGGAGMAGRAIVQPETKASSDSRGPEDGVSKVFTAGTGHVHWASLRGGVAQGIARFGSDKGATDVHFQGFVDGEAHQDPSVFM